MKRNNVRNKCERFTINSIIDGLTRMTRRLPYYIVKCILYIRYQRFYGYIVDVHWCNTKSCTPHVLLFVSILQLNKHTLNRIP